jgi:hypothetical protein
VISEPIFAALAQPKRAAETLERGARRKIAS